MNTHPRSPGPDPVLLRGLRQSRLSRRGLMQLGGGLASLSALAACGGIEKQGEKADTSKDAVREYWDKQEATEALVWANWPLYLDTAGKGKHPTLDAFSEQTGIAVKYLEVIQDNAPFFAKVQPSLSDGQFSGYDLAVISNGIYFNRFRDLGFLVPLDQDRLPNFRANAGEKYQNESFDPGNVFSIPYQAGFTGIGYDPDRTGREITSWQDLLDPAFAGHVGMFANNEDTPNAAMLALGIDADNSTEEDWRKAETWLKDMRPNVRNYYGQNYINGLAQGDLWISMAWSGDIYQQNLSGGKGSNLKFVIPDEGGLLWTDNFVILKHAENPVSAMELMDYYYDPEVAADVAEWVNYISPVPAAKGVVEGRASRAKGEDKEYLDSVAESYAIFPDDAVYSRTANGFTPKAGEELDLWNSIFEPIYQS